MNIKPIVNQFSDRGKYRYLLCFNLVLQDILLNYGYNSIADYIGKEYCFYQVSHDSGISWYRKSISTIDELKDDYNFTITINEFDNFEEALNHLKDKLSQGILSMVLTDSYYLSYAVQQYKKIHQTHYISITGICFDHKTVNVLDPIYGLFNKEIEFDVIKQAWFSKWNNININYRCIDIIPPEKRVVKGKEYFLNSMRKNIEYMINPDLKTIEFQAKEILGNYTELVGGLKGLSRLSDNIVKLIQLGRDNLVDLFQILGLIPEQLELHANFIKNNAIKLELPQFLTLSDLMFDIVQNWAVFRNMILKTSFRDSEIYLHRCIERCNIIFESEKHFVYRLQELLKII